MNTWALGEGGQKIPKNPSTWFTDGPLDLEKTLFYTHAPLSSNKLVFGGVITILSNVPAELDLKLASCYCKVDGVVEDLYWYRVSESEMWLLKVLL